MGELKATPGPWGKTDFEGGRMAEVRVDGKLACLLHCFGKKPTDEDTANLNIIAAAPDMYEELECARDVFRFYQSHHEFKGGTEKAIRNKEIADRIDRLLAKARGDE